MTSTDACGTRATEVARGWSHGSRDLGDVATSGCEDSGTLGGAVARALLAELVAALKPDPALRRDVASLLGSAVPVPRADDRLPTVADVAVMLDVSERSVCRALRDGRLCGDRIGSSWRISPAAADDWRAGRRVQPVTDRAPRRIRRCSPLLGRVASLRKRCPRAAPTAGGVAPEGQLRRRSARYPCELVACLVLRPPSGALIEGGQWHER